MEIATKGVYIVTGGGGAIAGPVAEVFREAGARLVLADRSAEAVAGRAEALGALAVVADLTDPAAAARMVTETVARYGRVDGLIHTAGAFAAAPAAEGGLELYEHLFAVNVRTLVCAVEAVLPRLLAQDAGFLAGFASSAVWRDGSPGIALYAAAKGAVALYLRSLEKELRDTGVGVAVVHPMAPVDTGANRRAMAGADTSSWVDPAEIARALLFAATRPRRGRIFELPVA